MNRAVLVLLIHAGGLAAETLSIFGAAGYGESYDDEGNIGGGVTAQAGISYRLNHRFSAGAEYALIKHRREFPFAVWRGTFQHAAATGYVHFGSGKVQPYVVGGIGLLHYSNDSRSGTGWAWSGGAGFRGYVTQHVFVRPEVRLWVGDGGISRAIEPYASTFQFSIGLGYSF